jgi:thiol:disulfide interchange protein DsbC
MMTTARLTILAALLAASPPALAQSAPSELAGASALNAAGVEAQRQLQQTFTNLRFDNFGPSPVKGPIYQAMAGGRLIYFAPESEHLLFAAVYDRSGINQTALAEEAAIRRKLARLDTAKAVGIGPADAPTVIEFTDPDCPHCRALDRFWAAKAAEGKPVRRLVFFVTGIHAEAAAKAEHILCSADKEAAFQAIYAGAAPSPLAKCQDGRELVEAHTRIVGEAGIAGTPTLIAGGQVIAGFQQAELEAFLAAKGAKTSVKALPSAAH